MRSIILFLVSFLVSFSSAAAGWEDEKVLSAAGIHWEYTPNQKKIILPELNNNQVLLLPKDTQFKKSKVSGLKSIKFKHVNKRGKITEGYIYLEGKWAGVMFSKKKISKLKKLIYKIRGHNITNSHEYTPTKGCTINTNSDEQEKKKELNNSDNNGGRFSWII